jgi:hypothetical protein
MAADDDPPPVLVSWTAAYALVLGVLGAEVVLFSVVSWIFR